MAKGKGPYRLVLNHDAAKEIDWHCKHYVGRDLMVKYENGDALAKAMNVSPDHLNNTFK
jgi:hypothetical protein